MDRCPKCGWHHTDECMGENMAADHNPAIPRTRTPILISAMRLLARDIESEDGVANAAIAEAGNRLADLEEELERSNKFLEDAKAAFKAKVDVFRADQVGAPHRRQRAWIVAHAAGCRCEATRQAPRAKSVPLGSSWWAAEPPLVRVVRGYPRGLGERRALGNIQLPAVAHLAFETLKGRLSG